MKMNVSRQVLTAGLSFAFALSLAPACALALDSAANQPSEATVVNAADSNNDDTRPTLDDSSNSSAPESNEATPEHPSVTSEENAMLDDVVKEDLPTYTKENFGGADSPTLSGDLVVNDSSTHDESVEVTKDSEITVEAVLDVKPIQNQMNQLVGGMGSMSLSNTESDFVAVFKLYDGAKWDNPTVSFSDENFYVPATFTDGKNYRLVDPSTLVYKLTIKEDVKKNIKTIANLAAGVNGVAANDGDNDPATSMLKVTLTGIKLPDNLADGSFIRVRGWLRGTMDSTVNGNVLVHFSWNGVQAAGKEDYGITDYSETAADAEDKIWASMKFKAPAPEVTEPVDDPTIDPVTDPVNEEKTPEKEVQTPAEAKVITKAAAKVLPQTSDASLPFSLVGLIGAAMTGLGLLRRR